MPFQSPFCSSAASFSRFGSLTPCMFLSRVVNVPSGIKPRRTLAAGDRQPESSAASATPAATRRRRRPASKVRLIDVALLLDPRLLRPALLVEIELAVPPQRPPGLLLREDLRPLGEQLADHTCRVGLVARLDLPAEHGLPPVVDETARIIRAVRAPPSRVSARGAAMLRR